MVKDYYFILEVAADADLAVIKSAYRRLAKKYHPDLNPSHDAQDRMKALTEAYAVLSDADKRARYDRKRIARSTGHAGMYDTPPPRKSRKEAYAEIKISESQIAEAIRLSRINLILTSTLLERRFGLDYDHAAKLFKILIRRGMVDEDGRWTDKARQTAAKSAPKTGRSERKKYSTRPPPAADAKPRPRAQEYRIGESLVAKALEISRTNYMLSVAVLQKRLGLDHDKASRLYALLMKRGYIDDVGVWTDAARSRAKAGASRAARAHDRG